MASTQLIKMVEAPEFWERRQQCVHPDFDFSDTNFYRKFELKRDVFGRRDEDIPKWYNNVSRSDITGLGVDIINFSNALNLEVKQADKFFNTARDSKFIGEFNEQKIWSINFHGNQYVQKAMVDSQKKIFNNKVGSVGKVGSLKFFKAAGYVMDGIGIGFEVAEVAKKRDAKSLFSLGFEVGFLVGGLFLGGVPALVLAGGLIAINVMELVIQEDVSDAWYELLFGELERRKREHVNYQNELKKGQPQFLPGMSQREREMTARELRLPDFDKK